MGDLIKSLPHEVVTSLFSLLPTPSLSLCNAVSTEWRKRIQSDMHINRILDLSRKAPTSEQETIDLLIRLLATSSIHPRQVIHLDIGPFWTRLQSIQEEYPSLSSPEDLLKLSEYQFLFLVSSISFASKGRLSKLFLETNVLRTNSQRSAGISTLAIVESTLLLRKSNSHLKEIHFTLPSGISLEIVGEETKVTIQDSFSIFGKMRGDVEWDPFTCRRLLQSIQDCTKGRFTDMRVIRLRGYEFGNPSHTLEFIQLLTVLQDSQETLQHIQLVVPIEHDEFGNEPEADLFTKTWNLVKKCSKLSSLTLELYPEFIEEDLEEQLSAIRIIHVPESGGQPVLQLKKFKMLMGTARLRSDQPFSWIESIGSDLEELHLEFGYGFLAFEVMPQTSFSALVPFMNSNASLRSLTLTYIKSNDANTQKIKLPNLQTLYLSIDYRAHQMFSDAELPDLRTLSIDLTFLAPPYSESTSEILNLPLPILNCNSSLSELRFIGYGGESRLSPSQVGLVFDRLSTLSIINSTSNIIELLSRFQFPSVEELTIKNTSTTPLSLFGLLASASASLTKFVWDGPSSKSRQQDDDRTISGFPRSLSFPNLKTIVMRPSEAGLLAILNGAGFQRLESLSLRTGRVDNKDVEAIFSILEASSTTLKDLDLSGRGFQVESSGVDGVGSRTDFKGIDFTKLRKLATSTSHLHSLLQIIKTSKVRSLTIYRSKKSTSTTQQIWNLLVRLSSHLKVAMMDVDYSSEEKEMRSIGNSNGLVDFPNLEMLFFGWTDSDGFLKEFLSNSRVPKLEIVDLYLKSDLLDEGQRLSIESTLRSKSSNFKRFSVSGSVAGASD